MFKKNRIQSRNKSMMMIMITKIMIMIIQMIMNIYIKKKNDDIIIFKIIKILYKIFKLFQIIIWTKNSLFIHYTRYF